MGISWVNFNAVNINEISPNKYNKKRNKSTLKLAFWTVGIIAFIIAISFVYNEFFAGGDKPNPVDPIKPNDTTDQPVKIKKNREISYQFDCLKDEKDLGTTEAIDVLEGIDKEVTNALGGEISVEYQEDIGKQLLSDCRGKYHFIKYGAHYENLKSILKSLVLRIKKGQGFNYQIFLIESDELNAFTAGAKIFMTTRMYDFCKSNDELACIIGHEINHNELGHIKEHLQKEIILTQEGAALAQMATISFGQKKETHCDMTGIDLAIAAGYNGCVNINLWKRMQKEFNDGEFNALDNLFRSHPYSQKRSDCSKNHIESNYGFICPN